MASVALICLLAATRLPFFGGEFLPAFREGHLVLQVFAAPGTSVPEMIRIGTQISRELLKHKNIDTVEQQVGRAELGEDPWGPHRSELHVELKPLPGKQEAKVADEVRDILKQFPGIQFEVLTFLGDRIGETLTGETAPVVVNIFGEDLDVLDAKAFTVGNDIVFAPGEYAPRYYELELGHPPVGHPRMLRELEPPTLEEMAEWVRRLEMDQILSLSTDAESRYGRLDVGLPLARVQHAGTAGSHLASAQHADGSDRVQQ